MIYFKLAFKSLRNRFFSSVLTVISISLSVSLLLAVHRTQRAAEEGFTQSVSQVDLLVGARTGPLNLILFTVFNMGSASNHISMKTYLDIKNNPQVEWTVPYSIGDGHKGFRVVGTDENFYQHYRFRENQSVELQSGEPALDIWSVVIGAEVQKKLKYKLGDKIIMTHGVTHGIGLQHHENQPFQVSGILKPTGTPIDQTLYISLYGMAAMHSDWSGGAHSAKKQPEHEHEHEHDFSKESLQIDQITAFFLRSKSRIETLKLQREINSYSAEPLTAIIPSATLSEFWRGLSQLEMVLKIISFMVLVVGFFSMLSTILAGLNERRREMSILRSIGAGPKQICLLFVFESALLTFLGIVFGLLIELSAFFILSSWLNKQFGFYVSSAAVTQSELVYFVGVFIFGICVGVIPALRASKMALKDGLSARI